MKYHFAALRRTSLFLRLCLLLPTFSVVSTMGAQVETKIVTPSDIPSLLGIPEQPSNIAPTWLSDLDVPTKWQIHQEDSLARVSGNPYRFAVLREANCDAASIGTWDLSSTHLVWQHKIESEGAVSMSVVFHELALPDGAEVYVYCPETGWLTGPITNKNFPMGEDEIASEVLPGGSVQIVYKEPKGAEGSRNLVITKIGHGYRLLGEGEFLSEVVLDRSSGSCNVDITDDPRGNCFSMEKRAEALLLRDQNTKVCSGTMIVNTGFQTTLSPYYLTAHHCLFDVPENPNSGLISPATLGLRFRYWTNNSAYVTYTGITYRALTGAISDAALIELTSPIDPTYEVFYAGWSRSLTAPSNTSIVHHPDGDVTKISFDAAPPFINTAPVSYGRFQLPVGAAWVTDYGQTANGDWGTTEIGTSGCPLLNPSHLVIGDFKGGPSPGCTVQGNTVIGERHFGTFAASWGTVGAPATSLAPWLDPLGTAPTTHVGTFQLLPGSDKIPCKNFVQSVSAPAITTNNNIAYRYTWTSSANIQRTGTGANITFKAINDLPPGSTDWIECQIATPTLCGSPQVRYKSVRRTLTWVNSSEASLVLKTSTGSNAPSSLCVGQSYTFNLAFAGGFPIPSGASFNWSFSGNGFSTTTSNGGRTVDIYVNGPASQSLTAVVTIVGGTGCFAGTQTFYFYASACGGWLIGPGTDVAVQSLLLWPNPSRSDAFYKIPKHFDLAATSIELVDMSGILRWQARPEDFTGVIRTDKLKDGIYIVRVYDRQNQNIQRLAIQH
ncbi:MAG: T9SS type A sorting domain-containing protein [Saprospiraceae bacterium]